MKKLTANICIGLVLATTAVVRAQSYISGMCAFDSGFCRNQAGATKHTGSLGGWLHRPVQSSNYSIGPGAPLPGSASVGIPPILTIGDAGNSIRISWPKSASGYVLQESSSIDSGLTWTNVSGPYQTNEIEWFIILPATEAGRFYRLKYSP